MNLAASLAILIVLSRMRNQVSRKISQVVMMLMDASTVSLVAKQTACSSKINFFFLLILNTILSMDLYFPLFFFFLRCWKKQLTIAEETRSVDVLCRRLNLAKKLLKGTKKYIQVSEAVEEAAKSLETELCGPRRGNVNRFTDLPSAMRRGNVNRLQNAQKVKSLCSSALKSLQDTPLHDLLALPSKMKGKRFLRSRKLFAFFFFVVS